MKTVNVHEAKTRLSAILSEIERTSEPVMICRYGVPVADLVPHVHPDRILPHPVMRRISVAYNPIEPLAEDEWPAEER
ncbi:MAG: type II toxin-antitoxin system Phd/YefM family antitoxin [Candidatus Geothermincolia bacterium]